MVLNGDPTSGDIKPVVERAGGGGAPTNSKGDGMDGGQGSAGMDHIQGKLAAMQLGAGAVDPAGGNAGQHSGHSLEAGPGGDPVRTRGAPGVANPGDSKASAYHPAHGGDMSTSDLPKTHGNSNFFAFPPPGMALDVDTTGAGGAGPGGGPGSAGALASHTGRGDGGIKFLQNPNNGAGVLDNSGGGSQMFKKPGVDGSGAGGNASGAGGRAGGSGGGGDGTAVSRRYGVPMGSGNPRNAAATSANRGAGPTVAGAGVGFGGDDRRRGGGGGGGGGGRRGSAGSGMNGGMGVGAGRPRVPGARTGYGGEGASPVRGAVDHSTLQVPHMGYNTGNSGGMSPSSAAVGQGIYAGAGNGTATGGMGPINMQSPPVGVNMPGIGSSVHAGGIGGTMGNHMGQMDPSQALMGQMPSGMYYQGGGYGGGIGAQGATSPGLSHLSQAGGGYPTSPGHSVGYSLPSNQQMGAMDMQPGMAAGYPIASGGMVHNMGVLPGTPSMQAPFGAYWPPGDMYGGSMSNGANYTGGFPASETGVRDPGSRGSTNKNHFNQGGVQPGQRATEPHYGSRQPGYETPEYGRQAGYPLPSMGTGYGTAGFNYSPYTAMTPSPKLDATGRDRRPRRGRTGSVQGSVGFGGPDPQRESELTIATDNLSLEEIEGNVFRMSKDQIGCRLLQLKLDQGDPVFVDKICSEAQPYLADMMKDPFGNYLFQKIAEKVDEAGRTELVNKVADQMVEAGLNLHGTRSVQKVIEVCRTTPSQVALVVNALRDATVTLCLDTNGNHVVQRLLQHLAPADNAFVFEMLADACVPVATHRHGCCVLQRAMDAATPEQSRLLVAEVCAHALQLMQDPYGNYVVQYVLGICSRDEADTLVNIPLGKVAMLSMQKFSSNVIEKCMDRASEEVIVKYVRELADREAMRRLLQDQYANYVIQKTLQLAPRDAALSLVESIREHLPLMRNSSGGRRMLTKIAKRFPEINLEDEVSAPGAPIMESAGVEG